jgi:hypothetical protein
LQVRYSFLSLFHFFILTCRKRNRRSQNWIRRWKY